MVWGPYWVVHVAGPEVVVMVEVTSDARRESWRVGREGCSV